MDMDDDDAFLYGDQEEESLPVATAAEPVQDAQAQSAQPKGPVASEVGDASTAASGLSASMAASLAAYGIDPSAAVVENPEDGGVEEEEEEEEEEGEEAEDSDESEDDVKLVFSGTNTRLDLRKPQTAQSNVIGIGKWAHTSTGATAPAAIPTPQLATPTRPPQPTANQTTEYNPAPRPTPTPTGVNTMSNPPIPPSGDSHTAPILQQPQPNINATPSTLPPVSASSTHPKIDPSNPSGLIPSTGQSVFEIDMSQFESSGQPWRRPGSDLSDWFNFGFDEFTYPKYLRFKSDMEQGRAMLANLPHMNAVPPELAQLFHLQNIDINMMNMNNMNNMNQGMMNQMNAMAQAQMGMGNMGFNPQMQAQLQQMMAMQGMDMGMMNQGLGQGQGFGMQQGQGPQAQGPGPGMMQQNQMGRPSAANRPSATPNPQPAPLASENGEEGIVKQEDGASTTGGETPVPEGTATPIPPSGPSLPLRGRGGMPVRGAPGRGLGMGMGMAARGRGGVPLGPRASVIPTGPKAGRFKDKDRVVDSSGASAGALDYGTSEGGGGAEGEKGVEREREVSHSVSHSRAGSRDRSRTRSRSASPKRRATKSTRERKDRDRDRDRERERERERSYDYSSDYDSDKERERERERDKRRSKSRRDKEKDESRSKRKREDVTSTSVSAASVLGPEGWGSEGEDEIRRTSSSSRRKRSSSSDDDRPRRTKRR